MNSPSEIAALITAMSVLMGVTIIAFVAMRILRKYEEQRESLTAIQDRNLPGRYDSWRDSIEKEIAQLNRRLTDTSQEFESVNHLVIDSVESGSNPLERTKPDASNFLRQMGVVEAPDVEDDLIFVLTPFHGRELATFSTIVETFTPMGLRVLRGDEEGEHGDILRNIVRLILRARIVIANISSRNPNVMYELGIAHALGKPTLLVSSSKSPLAFDLQSQRIIFYKTRDELSTALKDNVLRQLLKEANVSEPRSS